MSLAILESENENIAFRIAAYIAGREGYAPGVNIASASAPAEIPGVKPDLVVVSPGASLPASPRTKIRCGTLLLPDGAPSVGFEPDRVVSYGMSPRDTVTLSSIGESSCMLSLQREVPTLGGGILDRQEFIVRRDGGPGETLATSGALLILGLQPE